MTKFFNILILILIISISGCAQKEKAAITIDDIEITAQEFAAAFAESRFVDQSSGGKKDFLDQYISKKLILHEAENMGVDKNPEFLLDVQKYWEQGLLKRTLDKKLQEFSQNIVIPDQAIKDYYEKNKSNLFADKELSQVSGEIRWFLLKEQQNKRMSDWVDNLKTKSNIHIDYPLLGIKNEK